MEVRILEERVNPLLKRREIRFEVSHPGGPTPARDAVRSELAKESKVPKDRVIIERIRARFGTATSRGDAALYDTKEAVEVVVREHILVRNSLKQKVEKVPAAAPEAPAAAAPARAEPPAAPVAPTPAEPAPTPKAEAKSTAEARPPEPAPEKKKHHEKRVAEEKPEVEKPHPPAKKVATPKPEEKAGAAEKKES